MISSEETKSGADAKSPVDTRSIPPGEETDARQDDPLEQVIRSSLAMAVDDVEGAVALVRAWLQDETSGGAGRVARPHAHYFKSVRGLDEVDVYRVLELFCVSDPCVQHAVKKLLVLGGRGGGKSRERDVRETIDTLKRWLEMRAEDAAREAGPC